MDDNEKKKIEDFNEQILKDTALTFSLEGFSKDLKDFIQKKITLNLRSLKYASSLISSISANNDREIRKSLLKSDSTPIKLLSHLLEELENTNGIINYVIQKTLDNESNLEKESTLFNRSM